MSLICKIFSIYIKKNAIIVVNLMTIISHSFLIAGHLHSALENEADSGHVTLDSS